MGDGLSRVPVVVEGGRCKKFRAWRICAHPERFCRTCDMQVSAFALVSAFSFGAARRRECVVMRLLRPLLARSSALSLPGVFECPLTHLNESGRDRLT